MLKLTYTENDFTLERLDETLENWVNTRVLLALYLPTNLNMTSSIASFLLPLEFTSDLAKHNHEDFIDICRCDTDFIEVSLKGIWLTSDAETNGGVFVTALSHKSELLLEKLKNNHNSCQIEAEV
ncbi:MAG: hypothetical protein HC908_05485 [Calothrix sp. SM1_7_51]|nr:hypothetical protein [Calothrix sp. SM1_7_51]